MSLELVLVRHAEAGWISATGRMLRDPDLTDRGLMQAAQLGSALKGERFDHLLVSPARRALQTAKHLELEAPPAKTVSWLREITYPDWSKQDPSYVERELALHDSASLEVRVQGHVGGESPEFFYGHVRKGFHQFLCKMGVTQFASDMPLWNAPDNAMRLCLMGHVGSISAIMAMLIGARPVPWERQRFPIGNCSISAVNSIAVGDHVAFAITRLGSIDHMNAERRPTV